MQAAGISLTAMGKRIREGQGMVLRANRPGTPREHSRLEFEKL